MNIPQAAIKYQADSSKCKFLGSFTKSDITRHHFELGELDIIWSFDPAQQIVTRQELRSNGDILQTQYHWIGIKLLESYIPA